MEPSVPRGCDASPPTPAGRLYVWRERGKTNHPDPFLAGW